MRRCLTLSAACALSTVSLSALGIETPEVGGEAVRVDITEATSVLYNVDNRNDKRADVTRFADDDWGAWYNRFNVQGNWKAWHAGLRLDSAWFYASPDATGIALDLLAEEHGGRLPSTFNASDARFFVSAVEQADAELSNRYINWIYPAKYYVGYTTPDVELSLGDFYAQFGRGFVLSVRKLDELSSDTTIRGARITGRLHEGPLRLKLTGLGGVMNPLRLDEGSGRYLSVDERVAPGVVAIAEAGMPRPVRSAFDTDPLPTYAPDRVIGAQIEAGTDDVQGGIQGSLLDRELVDFDGDGAVDALAPSVVRSTRRIATASASVNVPDLDQHGNLYLETAVQDPTYPGALQQQDELRPEGERRLPGTGYALYGSASIIERPWTFTIEGKHYRRFFPLQGNIDIARAREFYSTNYSSAPTTEAYWNDTEFEGFNTCVSGGRGKWDVQVGPTESVFAWVGHYRTWYESVTNERCRTSDDNLNRVWDFAVGFEMTAQRRRSRFNATVGSRFDDAARELQDLASGAPTHVFYRELYLRYDVTEWLGGPFSLEMQGWHRRRHQTLGGAEEPWFEGEHLTALHWAPKFVFGVGVEYDQNPLFPDTYLNGLIGYNMGTDSNVSVFVGQRRGGVRCVSGICRFFPPFEGIRADATFRF